MALHTIVEHDTTHIKPYIDKVKQALTDLTDLVEGATEITTKSFSPVIAVNDALPVNAVDVSAKIEPIQAGSGTPSPSNVRAISGRTEVTVTRAGKNLFNKADVTQYYFIDRDGELHENASFCLSNYIEVKGGTSITISGYGDNISPAICWYTKDKTYINGVNYNGSSTKTISLPSNASYVRMSVGVLVLQTAQLEVGETATSYEPYQGEAYTIQLGDTYYGGTLDVTTGVLTVDRGYAEFDGSNDEAWVWMGNNSLWRVPIDNAFITDNTTSNKTWTLNNLFSDASWDGRTDNSIGLVWGSSSIYLFYSTVGKNESDLRNFLASNPLQVVYQLNTPITVQLTPQEIQMLQGNNTIFTDSGDTSIQYYANGVKNLETVVAKMQTEADGAINNQFQNGCVNLLNGRASSAVNHGITWVVYADGTVIANGTASGDSNCVIRTIDGIESFIGKRIKVSGCPSGGSATKYGISLYRAGTVDGSSGSYNDYGDGVEFVWLNNGSGTRGIIACQVKDGVTVTNLTFKPMITLADVPNSDYAHYVPYTKSNKELTELWNNNKLVEYDMTGGYSQLFSFTNATRKFLVNTFTRHCMVRIDGVEVIGEINSGSIAPIAAIYSSNFKPPYTAYGITVVKNGTTYLDAVVAKNNTNDVVSLTAKDTLTVGSTINAYIEWSY